MSNASALAYMQQGKIKGKNKKRITGNIKDSSLSYAASHLLLSNLKLKLKIAHVCIQLFQHHQVVTPPCQPCPNTLEQGGVAAPIRKVSPGLTWNIFMIADCFCTSKTKIIDVFIRSRGQHQYKAKSALAELHNQPRERPGWVWRQFAATTSSHVQRRLSLDGERILTGPCISRAAHGTKSSYETSATELRRPPPAMERLVSLNDLI